MVRSIGQRTLACLLCALMPACATVPVPAKRYVARASVYGAQDAKKDHDGKRDLAPELKKSGVLVQGGKIAVLPAYDCDVERNRNCYQEVDALEASLTDAGFWVEHWRNLRVPTTEPDPYALAKKAGIEHALLVDSYRVDPGSTERIKVGDISLVEQQEAKQPRPLKLNAAQWDVVGPRCINHFKKTLGQGASAPRGRMEVRLISLTPERVLWTHWFEERGADSTETMELFHDVPTQVEQKKQQRYWGMGMAATGLALGIGAGAGASRMSNSSTLVMGGIALIAAGLGSWLIYDSRPREKHAKGPVDVLCNPSFVSKNKSKDDGSSVLAVNTASSGGPASPRARVKALQASIVNEVTHQISLMQRSSWEVPKKKKPKKSKDKKSKKDDRVSALACRWEDQELRCKAACTRCQDPWEGPCEICRPPEKQKAKVMVLTQVPVQVQDGAAKPKKKKPKKKKGEAKVEAVVVQKVETKKASQKTEKKDEAVKKAKPQDEKKAKAKAGKAQAERKGEGKAAEKKGEGKAAEKKKAEKEASVPDSDGKEKKSKKDKTKKGKKSAKK